MKNVIIWLSIILGIILLMNLYQKYEHDRYNKRIQEMAEQSRLANINQSEVN